MQMSTYSDRWTPGEANDSRLSSNDTIQGELTPDFCNRGLFSPCNEAADWSAVCTEMPGSVPRNLRRRTSTETSHKIEFETDNKENLSSSMNDFQINKKNLSTPVADEYENRRAKFQSKGSQPSFLAQKDFTPILLGRLGKQISELNFDGHYRFIEVIGRGNFGEVWKAEHNGTKDVYAIKKSTRRFRSSKERNNHLREINSVSKLGAHENLVRYFRAWQVSGYMPEIPSHKLFVEFTHAHNITIDSIPQNFGLNPPRPCRARATSSSPWSSAPAAR